MESILAKAKKVADVAEVFAVSSEETHVSFETNRLKHLQTKQQTSVALRVIRQGKIGYATSTNLASSDELVKNAVETAQFGMTARFELPGSSSYPQIEIMDEKVESVSTEAMIKLGEELIATVTRHTPGIICEAGVTKGTVSVSIMNSRGGQLDYRKS